MCAGCCSVRMQKIYIFCSALFTLVLGILFAVGGPSTLSKIIENELILQNGTRAFDKWSVTPIPVYLNMYLFNWTNADQVREAGVKPNFLQMGPYVFSQRTSKEEITYFHNNNTVSFRNKRVWTWEPEMSNGSLDDEITAPHLPSLAAASIMRDANYLIKVGFNTQLNANGGALFKTHTAREWLFDGFEDQFLKFASNLPIEINLGPYKERFGWFYNRNGSTTFEGVFTVNTGAVDRKKLGELVYWKQKPSTGFFEGDCGKINGSSSDIFPPHLNEDEPITIFVTDTTRIINLYPSGREVTVQGIKGRRYETGWDTFDNGQRNEKMSCFCPARLRPDNCPPSGATSISSFAEGVPLFLSHPNFLYAEPHYAETITGLTPNFEKDIFFISLEPTLSVPLEIQANVMVSMKIQKDNAITILRNVPEYFYAPMFIVCNKAALPADIASEVKLAINMPIIIRYVGYGMIVVAVILFVLGIILSKTNKWCCVDNTVTIETSSTSQNELINQD